MDEILEKIYRQAQDYFSNSPVIVLGSGASAAHGLPGMWQLAEYLKNNITPMPEHQESWKAFIELLNSGVDLESSLHQVTLHPDITKDIIIKTWELINPKDIEVFTSIVASNAMLPLSTIIKKLFNSTASDLNIITTNYDRLAEYACDIEGYYHYSGFTSGLLRTKANKDYLKIKRKVNIWKVHGSLDWFRKENGDLIGLSNLESYPASLLPEIVTPGIEKYSKTHLEPYRTIIHEADNALETSNSYICIGYGFNDNHIQEKLVNKCVHGNAKLLILTRNLTDATQEFITTKGCKNYLAFEIDNEVNTKIYSSLLAEPIIVPHKNFWSLSGFLQLI